jgi:2-oxoisovalerate dehydrogenase E1 component alpha subunit
VSDEVAPMPAQAAATAPEADGPHHHETMAPGLPILDVTDGGPDMVQFLTADGRRVSNEVSAPYESYLGDLDEEAMRGLYRDLVLVRRVDAEGHALQRQGELGLWPSLLGQEAAQVGAGRAMARQDYAFPGYREHGVAWCKGVDPMNLLGMFRGVNHGGWDSNENNFHLYTIVIGNQMLHATGYAMGVQRDGAVGTGDPQRDTAVMAFTGDGGTAQGDYNEALVFASVAHAPVVFFVQNNQWAISEPNERQFRVPPYQRARGFGFPGLRVDGNDVLAVYAVTKHALDQARSGQGPTLIEAFTYRMGAHTTSDDPTKYRVAAEVDLWRGKDPIKRMRDYLEGEQLADADFFDGIDAEADALAAQIRTACQQMPDPELTTMFDHTYAEEHRLVSAEREEFAAYHAGFEGGN